MSQDPYERVQDFLWETKFDPLALLLDLTTLLPDSMVNQAISIAEAADNIVLQSLLIQELAKRLPNESERTELINRYLVPSDFSIEDVSIPEGKEAKKLIAQLSEDQRYEVFDQLFLAVQMGVNKDESTRYSQIRRPPETKSVDDDSGGMTSAEPPQNTGGDGEPFDDGFEAITPPKPQAIPEALEPTPKPNLVNLGFSHKDVADKKVPKTEPLQCGKSYYFWLRIGKDEDEAAIGKPVEFVDLDLIPADAVLTVAIFGFANELEITPGEDIGELQIQEGEVRVKRQPVDTKSIPLSASPEADFLERHLLFPISVPDKEATYRLRCNIYCEQVLVQSHVVSANVTATSDPIYPEARSQKLDYVLSKSLSAVHLNSMTKEPHLLSLMMNDNGDGSSSFRFFGSDGAERYKDDAQVDGLELKGYLQQARAALRRVSWGDPDEWGTRQGQFYRYQSEEFDETNLAKDLADLARAGARIYSGFKKHLGLKRSQLETLLANSGQIQIALKLSPKAVLPAAVVYDYPWDPNPLDFAKTTFELCPSFSKALKEARSGGPPLEDCVCFNGGCELKKMIEETLQPGSLKNLSSLNRIICPNGFWGYRHLLGLPLTLDGDNTDIPPVIEFTESPQMFSCVSTDPEFSERDKHLKRLKELAGLKFERDDGKDAFLARLRSNNVPQLLYFYCHGGVRADSFLPFLQVGAKTSRDDEIDPVNWEAQRIEWEGPNPLVFINGCHTTSLNPEVILDFVSSFVQNSGASGVIGTEITIFEPLAVRFAEECFKRFVGAPPFTEKMPIGRAVRGARLELLRQGNPLGLVYIPYAVASLRLQEKTN